MSDVTSLTPDLQERVRALADRAAFDLLERTGHEGNVAKWAELTRTLATRLEDVLIDLCRGSVATQTDWSGDTHAGDGPERNGLSPDPERRG